MALILYIKENARRLACMFLLLSLCAGVLSGCHKDLNPPREDPPGPSPVETEKQISQEELFDSLMEKLFSDIITSDSITLNYFLADPSRFGIEEISPTYGEVTSPETILKDRADNLDVADQLSGFSYDELRDDQQIIYDILKFDLELYDIMDSADDFYYYIGAVYPVNGVQIQLPIILAEFNFYTQADIEVYLQLLQDTHRYFSDLIEFERERSSRGFFLSNDNADKVIENCESFLADTDNNFMITVFNDRIDRYEGLSDEQREQFKERNRDLVLGNVLPAYEMLLNAIKKIRGNGANPGGLSDLPDGKEFAEAYLQYKAGTDRSPEQVDSLLEEWQEKTLTELQTILNKNPKLSESFFNGSLGSIRDDAPEKYLAMLEDAVKRDFPAIGQTRYVVREVHDSLREHVSPAFYLTPALDSYDDNVIYINPSDITDNISLFTTLAHEGYPGHLYQTVYYLQQSPPPLRTVMGDWGYTEGWATYAELQSYFFAGLDKNEASLLQQARLFDLLLYTRIDLGVNALGWKLNDVASMCRKLNITDRDFIEEVYCMVTGNPLLYLPYCLGYLEIVSLRDEAQHALGSDFSLLEFHRFLLDAGPAPFPVIRAHMQGWIAAQSSGALAPAA